MSCTRGHKGTTLEMGVQYRYFDLRSMRLGAVKVIPKAFAALTGEALASIEDPAVIKQILAHLWRKAEPKEFNLLLERSTRRA